MFKDQPWLLQVSGETRLAARNSQAYRSNVPSVYSAHISTHTERLYIYTIYYVMAGRWIWDLSNPRSKVEK